MTALRIAGALLCLAAAPLEPTWGLLGCAAFVAAIAADAAETVPS